MVGLERTKVGKEEMEVMVTVFCVEHPFTKLVVTRVYTPGGNKPDNILMVLLDVAMGTPPGKGLSGEYQSCCKLTVGLVAVPEKVTGTPELQVIT